MFLAEKRFCFAEFLNRCCLPSVLLKFTLGGSTIRFSLLACGSGRNKNKPPSQKIVVQYKHYKFIMDSIYTALKE